MAPIEGGVAGGQNFHGPVDLGNRPRDDELQSRPHQCRWSNGRERQRVDWDLFTASWLGGTGPRTDLVERARGGGGLPRGGTRRGDYRRRIVNSAGIRRWLASQHRRNTRPADRLAGPPHGELVQ